MKTYTKQSTICPNIKSRFKSIRQTFIWWNMNVKMNRMEKVEKNNINKYKHTENRNSREILIFAQFTFDGKKEKL